MGFATQICTTKEQSERLLALGLKKETADMGLAGDIPIAIEDWKIQDTTLINSPAWSLHRLLAMLTYQAIYNDTKYEPVIALDGMAYQDVCTNDPAVGWSGDLYTDVIDCIEWLISQEQFNPDYLK